MIATKLRRIEGLGEKWLYQLTPPFTQQEGGAITVIEYVLASAVDVPYQDGCETYLFPADSTGRVVDWGELDGSIKFEWDCDAAVRRMGYEVVTALPESAPDDGKRPCSICRGVHGSEVTHERE